VIVTMKRKRSQSRPRRDVRHELLVVAKTLPIMHAECLKPKIKI